MYLLFDVLLEKKIKKEVLFLIIKNGNLHRAIVFLLTISIIIPSYDIYNLVMNNPLKEFDDVTIFAKDLSNVLWYRSWNENSWDSWKNLGVRTSKILDTVIIKNNNDTYVFSREYNDELWYSTWNGTSLNNWKNLEGKVKSDPDIISYGDNQLIVFATGYNNTQWYIVWNGSSWSDWKNLNINMSVVSDIHAVKNNNDIYVFVKGHDDEIWYSTWNGTSLINWKNLEGRSISDLNVISRGDNMILFGSFSLLQQEKRRDHRLRVTRSKPRLCLPPAEHSPALQTLMVDTTSPN